MNETECFLPVSPGSQGTATGIHPSETGSAGDQRDPTVICHEENGWDGSRENDHEAVVHALQIQRSFVRCDRKE